MNQQTLDFIEQHRKDDVRSLALLASRYPNVDMPWTLDQIAGYQIAVQKLPTLAAIKDIRYPRHLSMEQCSSEITARYKAEIIRNIGGSLDSIVDLTAGYGIDFTFIAPLFQEAIAVEQQAYLCDLHRHNFPLLGLNHAKSHCGDSIDYLRQLGQVDWIYIDPARRDNHGSKVVAIADCQPNVAELEEELLQHSRHVLIKLSPMLDLALALRTLKHVSAIHVVSVANECKELLLVLDRAVTPMEQVPITAIQLGDHRQPLTFTLDEEGQSPMKLAERPLTYLYEPHAALIKSGAYKTTAIRLGLQKLHVNSHLYTSEEHVTNFPGRCFQIDGISSFGKKELKELLTGITQANLTVRNFPESVANLRKRLKLKEGGSIYLFATTLHPDQKILIKCSKC